MKFFVNEKSQLKELTFGCSYCFGGSHKDRSERFKNIYDVSDVYTCTEDDGEYRSGIIAYPYTSYINGTWVGLTAIGGVNTMPEHRQGGGVFKIFKFALEHMKEQGQLFSALAPFSYHFYGQVGYAICYDALNMEIPMSMFKQFNKKSTGTFKRLTFENDYDKLHDLFKKSMTKNNGATDIAKQLWKQSRFDKVDSQNSIYGLFKDEELIAAMGYTIGDRKFEVRFLYSLNTEATEGFFDYINRHNSQADMVYIEQPVDSNMKLLFSEKHFNVKYKNGMMGRIIDVKKLFELCNFDKDIDVEFTMKISDKYAPWNEEPMLVSIKNGSADISKYNRNHFNLKTDIGTLSQMFIGYINVSEALEYNKVTVENISIDKLNKVFKKQCPYMNEHF